MLKVYTDPNKLKKQKIKVIAYEMLEMASLGAKVMQPVSIQDARLNRIDIIKIIFHKKIWNINYKRSNIINNKIVTESRPSKRLEGFTYWC